MLALFPILVMAVISLGLFRRLASGPPIAWTPRMVATLSLSVVAAVAMPFVVLLLLR